MEAGVWIGQLRQMAAQVPSQQQVEQIVQSAPQPPPLTAPSQPVEESHQVCKVFK